MKTIFKITFVSILTLCLAISSYALPTTVATVESVDEITQNIGTAQTADTYSEYVPSPAEYQRGGEYGEVIVWEGFETYQEGTVISGHTTSAVYINSNNSSGITGIGIPRGTVCHDEVSGNKYVNCTLNPWPVLNTPNTAKAGTYTIVIDAKKAESETAGTIDVVIRGTLNGTANMNLKVLKAVSLTDSFTTYAFSYDYAGYTADTFMKQFQIRSKDGTNLDFCIDNFAVYYKPYDNYERPEFGNVICWEGYENRNIGETAAGNNYSEIYNENNGSNVTNGMILEGVVSAVPSTGLRYATVVGDKYVGIQNGQNAKRGTYTVVMRARKGTASRATVYIRRRNQSGSFENTVSKGFTLTEEFKEYSLSYDYEPSTEMYLAQMIIQAGVGIEVDSFALYYKPFDYRPTSYDDSSIRVADPSGIRFSASVTADQKAEATEYGFVVTLERHLGGADADTLTLDSDIPKCQGVSYGYDTVSGKQVDRFFKVDAENIFFTAVLCGIPATKQAYSEQTVVRAYLKDSDGTYHYAEPVKRSVLQVACAIRDAGYAGLDADSRSYVEGILNLCDETI